MEVNTSSTTDPVNMYNFVNSFLLNPTIFIIIFLVIIAFFILSSSLGNNSISSLSDSTSSSSGSGQNILGVIVIIVLVLLIVVNAFQYFFSINITAYITDLFTNKPVVNVVVDQTTYEPSSIETIKFKKQVFNVPGNYYNYTNAKALCNAYGGRLATYDEVEKSYNNGGEWCNYGWSDGQMALFPTQKKTFNNLQTIKGHEQDCGRPGINGGYIANPNVRFGVNCYGNKPRITDEEEELMKTSTPYPKTTQDIVFQKRVDYWKNKVDEILVSPFNYETWGSF